MGDCRGEESSQVGDRSVGVCVGLNVDYIRSLMEKRRSRYESVADITVATDGKSAEEICEEILSALNIQ